MSAYGHAVRSLGGKAASLAANEKPTRITVRAHTRAAPVKKVPLPPSLNPKADTRFTKPAKPAPAQAASPAAAAAAAIHAGSPRNAVHLDKQGRMVAPDYQGSALALPRALVNTGTSLLTGGTPAQWLHGVTQYEHPGRVYQQVRSARGISAGSVFGPFRGFKGGAAAETAKGLDPLEQATARHAQLLERQAVQLKDPNVSTQLQKATDRAVAKSALKVSELKAAAKAAEAPVGAAHVGETAAALRGAVSGKPARAALKTMGKYEKTGAMLDDPNFGKSVRQLQKEQKLLYSQERGKRFAAARVHLNNQALDPAERVRLAKNELKGELPKIKFQGFTELSDPAVQAMQRHILDHPTLREGQKIRASDALTNALTGKLPTPSELKILEHVFGKETTSGLASIASHPFKDTLISAMNVPRSLMASYDLSAPFRQGLAVATRHPVIFSRNLKPMLKAFGSEPVYHAMLDEIHARPTYPLMLDAKLSLTELGKNIAGREEQFASDLAEKIPVVGRPVRWSGRAYTGFLDKTRADVFDHLIERAQQQGINVHDDKFLKDLGRYVNTATGRGPLGQLQGAATALNAAFFSPRLLASRLDLIFSPLTYAKADPFVRKEAIRSMLQLAGTASTLLALVSQIPGVKVNLDPRNPDWGKIRIGNTRVDIAGGFQQPLRLFAQLATGVAISSTTGKKLNLGATGFGQANRLDLFLRFFEGKESPIASVITDWMRNSNQIGQKFSPGKEAVQHMIPLLAQDSYDLYNSKHGGVNGIAAAFAGTAAGSVGFGLQTYAPTQPKVRAGAPASYGGSGGRGGSPYGGGSSGGAGSAYGRGP